MAAESAAPSAHAHATPCDCDIARSVRGPHMLVIGLLLLYVSIGGMFQRQPGYFIGILGGMFMLLHWHTASPRTKDAWWQEWRTWIVLIALGAAGAPMLWQTVHGFAELA